MASAARPTSAGWQDPVRGHATYGAIQSWLVSQGIGGGLALAGFLGLAAAGHPDWLSVTVDEGLVMGALFAGSAMFLAVVNWAYMGREMARRLREAGGVPLRRRGHLRRRVTVLAVFAGLALLALGGDYALRGTLADLRADPVSQHPFFRIPSFAGLWLTLTAIALVHLLRCPKEPAGV